MFNKVIEVVKAAGSHVGSTLDMSQVVPELIKVMSPGWQPRLLPTVTAFPTTAFEQLYVTLGAQRATKILGIFARLDRRDGKPQYLRHIPRIWRYLRRSLIHPAMSDLKVWYDAHVPLPPQ